MRWKRALGALVVLAGAALALLAALLYAGITAERQHERREASPASREDGARWVQ